MRRDTHAPVRSVSLGGELEVPHPYREGERARLRWRVSYGSLVRKMTTMHRAGAVGVTVAQLTVEAKGYQSRHARGVSLRSANEEPGRDHLAGLHRALEEALCHGELSTFGYRSVRDTSREKLHIALQRQYHALFRLAETAGRPITAMSHLQA